MTETELAQALLTSGPAGLGVLVLAMLIKQWLGQVRMDIERLHAQLSGLEKVVQDSTVEAAAHRATVEAKLVDLERRVSVLEDKST